jgi:hypothetical protein
VIVIYHSNHPSPIGAHPLCSTVSTGRKIAAPVNLDHVSQKNRNEIEQLITKLLATMRKAKVTDDPLFTSLQKAEQELGDARRSTFDDDQSEYFGY